MHIVWKWMPPWAKNSYWLLGLSFLLWMLFFDTENLIMQYKLSNKLHSLAVEKHYYLQQIEETQQTRQGLARNQDLLEKFAREKYLMKRKTEDLYVVIDE